MIGLRRSRGRYLGVVALTVASACGGVGCMPAWAAPSRPSSPPAGAAAAEQGARPRAAAAACVDLSSWSIQRLAARTVIVPVSEADVTGVKPQVTNGAGGVILFGATAPANLGTQIAALYSPSRTKLLVMTDEEGGGVQRMENLVGDLPWARDMARQWTAAQIRTNVAAVARRMAGYGVNMDLAPVVDVDGRDEPPSSTNPDGWRSFSGTTSVVTQDGLAFARGLTDVAVIPVLKHFPGLGGSTANTDNGPANTLPWSTLQQVALPPFTAGIQAGMPSIMVANARVPGLTTRPASLSPAVITTQLRRTLGFRGLIMTDSLSARAISGAGYTIPRAAVTSLDAGTDMVMYGPTGSLAATRQTFDQIVAAEVAAVQAGTLSRTRLVQAVTHILRSQQTTVCA
jgi:beta-N-acetylhexosaminidase